MTARRRLLLAVLALAALAAALPAVAAARFSYKKGIWGPETRAAFAHFHDLGAGTWITSVRWSDIAPHRPHHAMNPHDRAYRWPESLIQGLPLARHYHMRVVVQISGAPRWANGGKPWQWAPRHPSSFGRFAYAMSKRFPYVHRWLIWGEPSRRANFRPEFPEHRISGAPGAPPAHMGRRQKRAPHAYARILDSAYGYLHRASRRNLVIGGNTFTTGDISPYNWIRNLRLPNGRPPRMDMYGHNPFTMRTPRLSDPPLGYGLADYSDLDQLTHWIDRYLKGRRAGPKRLKLFLAEFTAPTRNDADPEGLGRNHDFNFWVDLSTQARWVSAALRIARRSHRIAAMCWISLYDEAPRPDGLQAPKGLLTYGGHRKPSYAAYKRG